MIGLLAALRAYQPKRGAAFRTFAGTCIENAIQTALRIQSVQRCSGG